MRAAVSNFIMGVGKPLGWGGTLVELEAELARARAAGAPDDAVVSRAIEGSVYAAEIVWTGPVKR